ncbi:hypothetical protein [Psychrobacter faecalis]|uniref:hypothetical protein n=1 Tax=Psychrobacter faecalis TaxID=180588 RepID=UPI003FCF23C7
MRKENFQVGDVNFKWGDKLADVKSQISTNQIISENANPYAIGKNLTVKISEIWSIKTNSCEFSAPDDDRLIHRIWINLPPMLFGKYRIIRKLEKHLGPKSDSSTGDNHGSGSVIKNCNWRFDNCVIGISIYGDLRTENDEVNMGLLYIDLEDIELLDSLYSKPLRNIESSLVNKINLDTISIFQMQLAQRASWSMETTSFPNYDIDFISRAFNGFNKRKLFKTPSAIQSQITEFQVATWQSIVGDYYLSNHWETIELNSTLKTSWSNLLPAKGSGHGSISIGDFNVSNEHSRPETQRFIEHLEKILNTSIEFFESYDC